MDASGIADAATSIVKLIAFSSDVIKGLHQLSERYQDAQLVLHGIVVQVQALRTALTRIDELTNSGPTERHTQLNMDLDASLTFCDALLTRLGKDVKGLTSNGRLLQPAFMARLRTAFLGGPASEVQAMLDRQVIALNLLLTAYSCQSLSEQGTMLLRSENRNVFESVRSDALSLVAQKDTSSIITQTTDRLSRVSREFTFDPALFSTRIYSQSSAMLMRLLRTRHREQSSSTAETSGQSLDHFIMATQKAENETSNAITKQLRRDARFDGKVQACFITGNDPRSMEMLARRLRLRTDSKGRPLTDTDAATTICFVSEPHPPRNAQVEFQQERQTALPDLFVVSNDGLGRIGYRLTLSRGPPITGFEKWLSAIDPQEWLLHVVDLAHCDGNLERLGVATANYLNRMVMAETYPVQVALCICLAEDSSPEATEQSQRLGTIIFANVYKKLVMECYIGSREEFFARPWYLLRMWLTDAQSLWNLRLII